MARRPVRDIENANRRTPAYAGFVEPSKLPRGPNGFALCRWCARECPTVRHTFCGPACVHEHKCRTDPSYQAKEVQKRDLGVCCECGLDCDATLARLKELKRLARPTSYDYTTNIATENSPADQAAAQAEMTALHERAGLVPPNFLWGSDYGKRIWDMDHIIPVIEGGGSCGLSNLRTLCKPCHRAATKALAARRAEARRSAVKTPA